MNSVSIQFKLQKKIWDYILLSSHGLPNTIYTVKYNLYSAGEASSSTPALMVKVCFL